MPRLCRSAPPGAEREAGFTLVEVLVAFAIAAVLLVPLLRIFSGGIASLTRADGASAAMLWAQSVLAAGDGEAPLAIGTNAGTLDGGYAWQRSVSLYSDATMSQQLSPLIPYTVTVTVTWSERGHPRAVTLSTLRLAPPPTVQQ